MPLPSAAPGSSRSRPRAPEPPGCARTRHTGLVRIYLPASLDQLDPASGPFTARRAHAVTPALRALFPDEDDEGLEFAAQLAAADDSLELPARAPGRSAAAVRRVAPTSPTRRSSRGHGRRGRAQRRRADRHGWPQADVICVHVDEPAAAADVDAAAGGDEAAVERLDERDLLWYDASELVG